MPIRPINWLKLAFLGIVWGASFMAIELALKGAGPLFVAATRVTLGAIFLFILTHARGVGLPPVTTAGAGRIWLAALVMGLFSNAIPFALLAWGQQSVASGFAGVCMSLGPLFILPLAHIFIRGEVMTLRRTLGFLIGTMGVAILIGPAALSSTGSSLETWARLACLAVPLCYSIGTIATRLCPAVDMLSLSAAALLLGACAIAPYALWVEGWPETIGRSSLLALLYLGILPTGIAQIILVQIIRDAGPVFMSLVNYQVPVWSVIFGMALLGETMPDGLFWALALILSGVALSQFGALRRLFSGRRARG
ncbi:DMT family transporter [Roseovarius sp. SCSIO 43702]|uniref:DMT family transporter n=1 Tax=Roseovarius sp. SCSIO 43702 TaxID=2823043 RepID=UPI001C73B96E|nr:DMT family transporter [Roseovarius sp. SCSIO 43702]QYX57612.1 DMT family transporter [Roseovarius sp. SCSIO 43702]